MPTSKRPSFPIARAHAEKSHPLTLAARSRQATDARSDTCKPTSKRPTSAEFAAAAESAESADSAESAESAPPSNAPASVASHRRERVASRGGARVASRSRERVAVAAVRPHAVALATHTPLINCYSYFIV